MDKELILLDEIENNNQITQRELAERSGISLGNVNFLLKKMIREGTVKIEQIPANRVAYMLTPKGILEKANKTYNYIRIHYAYIEEQKQAMRKAIVQIMEEHEKVQIVLSSDEISEMLRLALEGIDKKHLILISIANPGDKEMGNLDRNIILVVTKVEDEEKLLSNGFKVVNLLKGI